MSRYFRAQIDRHVNGAGFGSISHPLHPDGVDRVVGDVTDRVITVTMRDGTEWRWSGGRYATRRVNLCYAPLMPKPVSS